MDPLIRICKHAMNDINNQLRKYQEKILLQKVFSKDAVIDPLFHKHGDEKHSEYMYSDLENKYLELSAFGKKLHQLIESADDEAFKQAMDEFIAQHK